MRLVPILSATAACALAACSGPPSSDSVVAGGQPSVVVESPHAGGSTTGSVAAPGVASGSGASSPASATVSTASSSRSGAGPQGQARGAAAGSYAVHLSISSSAGNGYDGPGTLAVDTAAADGTQPQTVTEQGKSDGATTTYQYLASGEVLILATGGRGSTPTPGCESAQFTFTPPVEAVPPTLTAGETWSGSFSGDAISGSYTAGVTGQGSDTVGGIGVAIWKLHGSLNLSGKVCGTQFKGTVTLDSDWAPSLRLAVASVQTTDATALGFHLTGRSAFELLSTTPS